MLYEKTVANIIKSALIVIILKNFSSQDSVDSQTSQDRIIYRQTTPDKIISPDSQFQKEKSPVNTAMKDVKGFLASSKNVLGKVLSPTKEKLNNLKSSFDKSTSKEVIDQNKAAKEIERKNVVEIVPERPQLDIAVREARPVKLMTRKQLTDPFGSDEEDEDETLTVQIDSGAFYIQKVLSLCLVLIIFNNCVKGKIKSPSMENKAQMAISEMQIEERSSSPTSPLDSLPKPTQVRITIFVIKY